MEHELVFERKKLLEGLRCVDVAVEKKTPLLQHFKAVRLNLNEGRVLLQSMNQGVSCDYLFNDLLEGEEIKALDLVGLVEHAKLYHIISKSKRNSIKITWQDRGIVVLAEGRSNLQFINIPSYDMQPTDNIEVVKESILPSELAAIWKATSFTISDDINTYNLHGLLYDGSWVTTTGFHVSIVKTDDPEITDRLLIIPAIESFIKLISGSALNITKMEMRRHQNKHLVMVVHTDIGKMRYMISLSNHEFPNYRKFEGELLTKCPNQFTISRAEFSDVLERIGVFVDNINHFVVLDVTPEHMEVTAKSSDKGDKTVEQIAFCGPPPNISDPLHMNSNYDILRKIASENNEEVIDFRYGDMRTSLVLTLGRKEYIIAPMVEVTR